MSLDVVLKNARIVDGTGSPWFHGSVYIDDGEIHSVVRRSNPKAAVREEVDVNGAIVSPGFIDLHSHSDLKLFESPTLEPKIRQGITTEILGQDGFSIAPMYREGGAKDWQNHISGLTGGVDTRWTWESLQECLDAIDEQGSSVNMAMLVGHGTVRYNVMGMSDRSPDTAELDQMCELVSDALNEGAIGFSTGLVYPPQVNASTYEVSQLAEQLHSFGRPFVAHIRSEGRWIWEAFDEFVDIGDEHEIPLHISHFKLAGKGVNGHAPRLLALFETARERGVDITADRYPYTAGNTMLKAIFPPWVHSGDEEELSQILEDEESRDRMHLDIEEWRIEKWQNIAGKNGWENLIVTNIDSGSISNVNGQSIASIATQWDTRPIDVVCDIILEEGSSVSMISQSQDEDDVRRILSHERVGVGTDAIFGGSPHPRTYGTFPKILGHYVRDEDLFNLEEAIRCMTSLPARAMGLDQKGVIRPGLDADLAVIKPHVVRDNSSYDDPRQYPSGIPYVMVDGEFVIKNGECTDKLPGKTIRA